MQDSPRRSFGATLMSLLLGWLAVGGFLNAFAWKAAAHAFNEPLPPRLAVIVEAAQSWLFTLLALAYGVAALVTSIGIWRMRQWMTSAFLAWSCAAMALLIWMLAISPIELPAGGKTVIGFVLLGTAAFLTILYFYVRGIARGALRAAL